MIRINSGMSGQKPLLFIDGVQFAGPATVAARKAARDFMERVREVRTSLDRAGSRAEEAWDKFTKIRDLVENAEIGKEDETLMQILDIAERYRWRTDTNS